MYIKLMNKLKKKHGKIKSKDWSCPLTFTLSKAYSSKCLDRLCHTLMTSSVSVRWARWFISGVKCVSVERCEAGRDTKQLYVIKPPGDWSENASTHLFSTSRTVPFYFQYVLLLLYKHAASTCCILLYLWVQLRRTFVTYCSVSLVMLSVTTGWSLHTFRAQTLHSKLNI